MRKRVLMAVLAFAGLSACSPGEPPLVAGSAADGLGGPRLVLEMDVRETAATAEIIAHELAGVFGLSFHVRWDETLVTVVTLEQHAFLDPERDNAALMLAHIGENDAALGGTRKQPSLGTVDVDAAPLATVHLEAVAPGRSAFMLTDVIARGSDGAYLPVAAAGGTLTLFDEGGES